MYIQCVFFYADQSICSFDPLNIVSGQSNISQNLRISRTFDKNTPTIYKSIFLKCFSLFSQKRYISLFQSKCPISKKWLLHMTSTTPSAILLQMILQKCFRYFQKEICSFHNLKFFKNFKHQIKICKNDLFKAIRENSVSLLLLYSQSIVYRLQGETQTNIYFFVHKIVSF